MHKNYEDLGFAKVDHHRIKRKGFPEVIFGQGKTPQQIAKIAKSIANKGHNVLVTRTDEKAFIAVKKVLKEAKFYDSARIIVIKNKQQKTNNKSRFLRDPESIYLMESGQIANRKKQIAGSSIAIISAGTSDQKIAEEAAITAEFLGIKVERFYDVGVSGIHRLVHNLDKINKCKVLIVVAGMEGALPSVIGGMVDKPIIAVPTSVGYGASFKGLSALLTMMNSCAPGVAVVNIDNGFGAAVMAFTILKN